jgi:hypothetical protein
LLGSFVQSAPRRNECASAFLLEHLLILMYLSLHRVLDRGQAAHPQFAVPPHENSRPFDTCVSSCVSVFCAEIQRAGL